MVIGCQAHRMTVSQDGRLEICVILGYTKTPRQCIAQVIQPQRFAWMSIWRELYRTTTHRYGLLKVRELSSTLKAGKVRVSQVIEDEWYCESCGRNRANTCYLSVAANSQPEG